MTTFTVQTTCGTERDFDTRRAAEDAVDTHVSLCEECGDGDARIRMWPDESERPPVRAPGQQSLTETAEEMAAAATNGNGDEAATDGDGPDPGVAGAREGDRSAAPAPRAAAEGAPPARLSGSVRTDPLDVVPSYMVTEVEGQPTINKRGYAVIATHFDIVVHAEPITTAGETDHEYAEFRARAWRREDGPEHAYTGHATARASEERRGMADNLNEMAETRAMKRAVAWASGVGILAYEEMAGYLDESG